MASSHDRSPGAARRAEYGQYIDREIEKTGRQVKLTELFGGIFLLVVGLLVFFLAAAIIDHWIVPLRSLGRWGLLLMLVGGVGTFVVLRLLPLVFRRVNPVYSAQTIERQAPAMKNSLLNHLVLRQDRQGASKGVLRAVEQQAAQRLSQASVDSAVDRGRLIRLGYLLVGLMAVAALYKFFSPKDPLATFGRIAAPWSDIDAPTRVVIEQVRHNANTDANAADPAAGWVYADQKAVEVEAVVRGLKGDEPVTLYWSTEDGRVDKQPIVMRQREGRPFHCYLPEENLGLRQDVRFYVAAGDARSAEFRIEVRTPPVIAVRSVEYQYPAYTGKRPETRQGGDITALAGTTVILRAEANQPIKSGTVDLGSDGRFDAPLEIAQGADRQATATLRLAIDARGDSPTSYLVRMTNAQGHDSPKPIRYNLEIVRDRPPVVKIAAKTAEPATRELQVPLNGSLPIVVRASDPDFALSSVHVVAAPADSASNVLLNAAIFPAEPGELAREFTNEDEPFVFRPGSKDLNRTLKVGDTVHLWAAARDNQHNLQNVLDPNVTLSEKLVIHITAPTNEPRDKMQPKNEEKKPNEKKPNDKDPPKEQPKDSKQPGGGNDKKKQDDAKQGKQKPDEKKQDGSDKKQPGEKQGNEKQGNEKQGNEGAKSKEDSKSGNGPKDLNQLVDQVRKEAEKEKQAKKQPPPDGSGGKQKGPGGASSDSSPDAQKNPDQSPSAGAGKKKSPPDKSNPGGGAGAPSETLPEPMTGDQGTTSGGQTSDNVGRNKSANDTFSGAGKTAEGTDTASAKQPPSNASDTKQKPGTKENGKGKAADEASKTPSVNPKSNPDATGKAGTAPNTSVGDKKSSEGPKEKGGKDSAASVPQKKSGTGGNADEVKDPMPTPEGLTSTKTKINNKEQADQGPPQKQDGKAATAPSTDDRENSNKNKSANKDGDKAGGSSPGGGQRGKAKGTGADGTHEEANGGSNAGKSPGTGETSSEAGKKVKAGRETGESGDETGAGSTKVAGGSNPGAAKSRPGESPGGSKTDAGSAGGLGKQGPDGGRGAPQTGPGGGPRNVEPSKPGDPDLEAARQSADLVLDYIKDHPDEKWLQEPRVVEMINKLRAMRGAADQNGPDGDIARQQLRDLERRGLARSFSTRGMKSDGPSNANELRGASKLPGYDDYLDDKTPRPMRKQ